MVSLMLMVRGFDVGRAVGAGLGDRRRVLEFIDRFAAAWTRPLALEDGYGEDVLRSIEEHVGYGFRRRCVRLTWCSADART
jgi:hypothetical protein